MKQEISPAILIAAVVAVILLMGGLAWYFFGSGNGSVGVSPEAVESRRMRSDKK